MQINKLILLFVILFSIETVFADDNCTVSGKQEGKNAKCQSELIFTNHRDTNVFIRVLGLSSQGDDYDDSQYVSYLIYPNDKNWVSIPNGNSIGRTLLIASNQKGTIMISSTKMTHGGNSPFSNKHRSGFQLQISTDSSFQNGIATRWAGFIDSTPLGYDYNGYWEIRRGVTRTGNTDIAAYGDTAVFYQLPNTKLATVNNIWHDNSAGAYNIDIYSTGGKLPAGFFAR